MLSIIFIRIVLLLFPPAIDKSYFHDYFRISIFIVACRLNFMLQQKIVGMKMGNLTNSSHAITKSLKPPCKQARSHERRALNLPNSSKASSKARNVLLKSILAKNQAGVESRARERIIIIQRGSRVVGCLTSVSFSWSLNEASSKARNVDICSNNYKSIKLNTLIFLTMKSIC